MNFETMGNTTIRMKKTQPLLDARGAFVSTQAEPLQWIEADNATAESLAASCRGDFDIFGKNGFVKIPLFILKLIIFRYIYERCNQNNIKTQK